MRGRFYKVFLFCLAAFILWPHRFFSSEPGRDTAAIGALNRGTLEFILKGDYGMALKYADSAKKLAEEFHFKNGLALALNFRGMIYRNKGNNEKALENYLAALKLFEETGDTKKISSLNHNISRIYENLADYSKALAYLFKALKIKEANGDKRGMANTMGHIGDIYFGENNDKALEYYQKSLKIQEELKNLPGITIALNQVGKVYQYQGDYQKAIDYFFRSLKGNETANYKPEIANSFNHIGAICKMQGKNKEALDYCLNALKLATDLNNKEEEADILINIGQLYLDQKEYKKALDYLEKAKLAADSSGVLKKMKDTYVGLSKAYELLNNHEKALLYYKLYTIAKDSIYNHRNRKAAISSQLKYEYEKKALAATMKLAEEKKLAEVRLKQEKTQRYALIVSLIFLVLLGFFILQRLRHKEKLNEYRLRDKIASDLHDDIGSALSSISMFSGVVRMNMASGKTESTVKKIEETSRETIESMNDIVWSVQPKNNKLQHISERMQTFANNLLSSININLNFNADVELNNINLGMEQRRNFYLIFKEAINNAAKYSGAKNIMVDISRQSKQIKMFISDDGMGFRVEEADSGNGLYTMKQRAKELNGDLQVISEINKGTQIVLVFRPT